jgi:hypothetical protein
MTTPLVGVPSDRAARAVSTARGSIVLRESPQLPGHASFCSGLDRFAIQLHESAFADSCRAKIPEGPPFGGLASLDAGGFVAFARSCFRASSS